ncbi:hypothetical protein ACTVT4_13680, partial [Staphylococcus aureus]|uniref:hypothetical protein n=1 Tax=Staphylococcus aureus TaxID=1280 RepID=UPI003FA6EDCD
AQDASVRVYIYRLRKKLDEYYALRPPAESRLFIPRGEYRLALTSSNSAAASAQSRDDPRRSLGAGGAGRSISSSSGGTTGTASAGAS